MGDRKRSGLGPQNYWHIGPVYVRKALVLIVVILLSAAVLLLVGFSEKDIFPEKDGIPSYRYNDPELAEVSGQVQVLDSRDRVRYTGEVKSGSYTGRGQVFSEDGELLYSGPLVDGVYQGTDAKVYQDGVLVYHGEMAENLYEGQGRRIAPETGVVSEGQFSRGFLEGQGQEFSASGILLREGTFSKDLLHGEGLEYTAYGTLRYAGQFWRGVYHGQGTLYNTTLEVPSASGTFVYGILKGQGELYHPSGQLLYSGQVYGEQPRADAFLGLSLAEVEGAFSSHWLLYSCGDITAFVYPYFKLMFISDSPVSLESGIPEECEEEDVSPAPAAEEERLSPEIDKRDILITQVLSYGGPLPGVPQPEEGWLTGQHDLGWREWFSDFAVRGTAWGAVVRRTGPFVWRFAPSAWVPVEQTVEEQWAEGAGLETMTVQNTIKDTPMWYQTAQWKEER